MEVRDYKRRRESPCTETRKRPSREREEDTAETPVDRRAELLLPDATEDQWLMRRLELVAERRTAASAAPAEVRLDCIARKLLESREVADIKSRFVSDLSEQFCAGKQRETELLRQLQTCTEELADVQRRYELAHSGYLQSEAEKRAHLAELSSAGNAQIARAKQKIDILRSQIENYRRLTGLEISTLQDERFRCRVKVQRNELIFKIRPSDGQDSEVEVVSYTVSSEKVPDYLKEVLALDQDQEAILLHKVISCLI